MASDHVHLTVPATTLLRRTTLNVTLTLTRVRWWRLRRWAGLRLIRLAAWTLGCNLHVDTVIRRVS